MRLKEINECKTTQQDARHGSAMHCCLSRTSRVTSTQSGAGGSF